MVQAIGAAETKLFDFGAPKRIDGEAAIKLVNVAKDLGVTQYIMVTSLGTGKIGFPASRCHRFCPIQTDFAQFKQVFPSSNRFSPMQQAAAVTLLHVGCNQIVRSCWLISDVYPSMCSATSSSHVLSSGRQELSVFKGSRRKWLQERTLHGQAMIRLRAHMLGLKAGSSDATSVPSMIAGISLYHVRHKCCIRAGQPSRPSYVFSNFA